MVFYSQHSQVIYCSEQHIRLLMWSMKPPGWVRCVPASEHRGAAPIPKLCGHWTPGRVFYRGARTRQVQPTSLTLAYKTVFGGRQASGSCTGPGWFIRCLSLLLSSFFFFSFFFITIIFLGPPPPSLPAPSSPLHVDLHGFFPEIQEQVLNSGLHKCIETKVLGKAIPSCFDMRLLQDDSTSLISSEKRRRKQSVISSPWLWISFFSVISDTRIYLVLALILKTEINRHFIYIFSFYFTACFH